MPVERSIPPLRLLSSTLLAGTGFAMLDVAIQLVAGSGLSITYLSIVALGRMAIAVPMGTVVSTRLNHRLALVMASVGVGGMIAVMGLYLVLLRMQVVSAGPVEWAFFLSSLAFQTIGTGGFGKWITEYVSE